MKNDESLYPADRQSGPQAIQAAAIIKCFIPESCFLSPCLCVSVTLWWILLVATQQTFTEFPHLVF